MDDWKSWLQEQSALAGVGLPATVEGWKARNEVRYGGVTLGGHDERGRLCPVLPQVHSRRGGRSVEGGGEFVRYSGAQDDPDGYPASWDTTEYDEFKRSKEGLAGGRCEVVQADAFIWAEGGNLLKLKRFKHKSRPIGGGVREEVMGFSSESRTRLLTKVASIDQRSVDPRAVWFVTLTYPGSGWPDDPRVWKKQLQAFQKRMRRAWNIRCAIWKMEPQRRGAPHFHLLLFVPVPYWRGMEASGVRPMPDGRLVTIWKGGQLAEFRTWLSTAWFEVVGSGEESHRRAGTNCQPIEAWGKVTAYAAKYLGKTCSFYDADGSERPVGRYWGIWCEDDLPVQMSAMFVPPACWNRVRRAARAFLQSKGLRTSFINGRERAARLFLPADVIRRLVAWQTPVLYEAFPDLHGGNISDVLRSLGLSPHVNEWLRLEEIDARKR